MVSVLVKDTNNKYFFVQSFYGAMSSWLEFPHGCHPRDVEVVRSYVWYGLYHQTMSKIKLLLNFIVLKSLFMYVVV